jgi:hypothetical protein
MRAQLTAVDDRPRTSRLLASSWYDGHSPNQVNVCTGSYDIWTTARRFNTRREARSPTAAGAPIGNRGVSI